MNWRVKLNRLTKRTDDDDEEEEEEVRIRAELSD